MGKDLDSPGRSQALVALLKAAMQRHAPDVSVHGADKEALLKTLWSAAGPGAVWEAGLSLRHTGPHPVLDALIAGRTAVEVMERWRRLERFGHTVHRTRVLEQSVSEGGGTMVLEHFALSGDAILAANDVFVWGLLVGLMERAGVQGLSAHLGESLEGPHMLNLNALTSGPDDASPGSPWDSVPTARMILKWKSIDPKPLLSSPELRPGRLTRRLEPLLTQDLVRPWRLDDVAQILGLSRRSMQRHLKAEGVTFSTLVLRVRVEAARALIRAGRLSLTEVAFCTGFADQAHFTRSFRKLLDVPPSAFRDLVTTEA